MKSYLALTLLVLTSFVHAVDTTPPTLNITHTWIEKAGTRSNFKMLLDPKDETGLLPVTFGTPPPTNNTIWFRSALNNPNANLSALPWNWWPWQRGVPFEIGFTCTACVIELQARDAAGNASAVQRRVFQSPFPYSTAPDTDVKLGSPTTVGSAALDCRGLFSGNLDGQGFTDLLQVDRTTGVVTAKLQPSAAPFPLVDQTLLTLTANTIEDSAAADYDKDGRLDLAMIVSGALRLYHNDGLNGSNQLAFTEVTVNAGALNGTTLSTITGVAFGDITGEGKPEILLSGVNGSNETIMAWLDNNSQFTFLSGNKCPAPSASTAGRVAVGDVTGDGFADVVMIDPGQSGVLLFQNDGTGILMGEDRTNAADRPIATQTGGNFGALVPKSLAVGDVTGDGRADAIVMVNWLGSTNGNDSNDVRMHQFWQLLDSRGRVPFHASGTMLLGQSSASDFIVASESARLALTAPPLVSGNTVSQGAPASLWKFLGGDPSNPANWQTNDLDAPSDVLLQDLNRDRFPEVVLTSQFEPGTGDAGGVRAYQVKSTLNATNQLTSFDLQEVAVPTNSLNPHRLAAARWALNKASSIIVAHNDSPGLVWIFNTGSETSSTAPVAIIGATTVDTDPDGTDGPNGIPVYTAFPTSLITYTLTIINNTASPLTNAVIDSLLPPAVTPEDLGGGTVVASSTSNYVRWTETVPANTSLTKQFTARVKSTALVASIIQPKNNIKYGTTNVSSYMPKVTVDEPITFALLSANSTSDPAATIVHYGEFITYRMRLTNRGKTAITNTVIGMNMPVGSIFDGPVSPVPGTTQVVNTAKTRIDITVTSLAPESYQDVFVNVEARGADNSLITNSTMTAQRPSGSKRTLAAVKTTIKPAIDVEWYSVYSEFSPRDQSAGEPLKGTQVHFGEIIRYRPKLVNRSANAQLNVKLGIPVPVSTIFDGPVSTIPGMTYVVPTNKSRIDFTITNFPGSTYNPDGTLNTLSTNTDARLDVECRAADYVNVTQSATTVQVPGRAIVNPGTYTFLCRPALEIDLKTVPANLATIRPGETITYELQAKNWGINKVTTGKVISRIPYGTKLKSALADDGSGTAAGPGPDTILGTSDDVPFRSGDFLGTAQLPHELSATSKPAYILKDQLLVWDLGQVDPGMMKTVRYSVTVATDIGQEYFSKALLRTLTMDNTNYNFVGTANTGKRIFAFVPISPTLAAPANADPYWMNSATGKAPPVNIAISTSNPLPKPKLQIVKHVLGPRNEALADKYALLPTDQATADVAPNVKRNDWLWYVENDSTVLNDAVCSYALHYFNTGGATATNVRVKDVIPTGMTFVGFLAKNRVLMGSYPFSHFYDAAGKELDMNVVANTTKVRSFDLYGGDLAIGEGGSFIYQCVAADALAAGTIISSLCGGKSGTNSGLIYTAKAGYHLTADQLHFPVDGSPEAVHVKLTPKVGFVLPIKDGWKSGHGMAYSASPPPAPAANGIAPPPTVSEDDEDSIMITMPYDVRGDAGAAPLPPLSNVKMSFLLPKGYKTDDSYVNSENNVKLKTLNAGAVVEGSGYVSAIRQADGRIKVTFPLDDIPFAWPTAHIIYDPLYKATLLKNGVTVAGADIEVNLSGFYGGGGGVIYNSTADATTDVVTTATPHGCLAGNWVQFTVLNGGTGLTTGTPYVVHSTTSTTTLKLAERVGGAPIDITANATTGTKLQRLPDKAIPPVKSFIHIDSRSDADKDSKCFVGRCAPVSVKRGDIFTYTIFMGGLSSVDMGAGDLGITVPVGCEAISATNFYYNCVIKPNFGTPYEFGGKYSTITPAGTLYPAGSQTDTFQEVRWSTPKPAGTVIKWNMPLYGNIGGAVQLKLRVLESFTGNAIIDKTCYFKPVNAMPKYAGASAIVVREGDVDGQLAEILQRHLQGVKFKHNRGVEKEITKTLVLDENTCAISIGGADVLQFLNGVNLIPLPNDRVMLIGPPDHVVDAAGGTLVLRTLVNDPMMRITCGFGTSGAVSLVNIPGYTGVTAANQVLTDLGTPGLNVLASKVANIIIGGGNNLVRSGGSNFAAAGVNGAKAPKLMLPGALAIDINQVLTDAKLVGQDGHSIVAGGGGNATTGEGGQMVAPGATGLIGKNGAAEVPANDGAGVIGQSGSAVLSHNGNALIGGDGASLIGGDGASILNQDNAGLVGQDGHSFIGTGVGTMTSVSTGSGK
ncbi:MAG: VCBS repeat-containing protein [Verrucomicrobiaceae bacterium]|nr:VCBS repeat-containing protein [Verrucomicrobiaceae bacterium]